MIPRYFIACDLSINTLRILTDGVEVYTMLLFRENHANAAFVGFNINGLQLKSQRSENDSQNMQASS